MLQYRMESKDQYLEWVEQIQIAEIKKARKHIARGKDIDQVLEAFSRSLMNKLLHPIIQEIRNVPVDLDALEQSKVAYFEKMKIVGPRADHIKDDDE